MDNTSNTPPHKQANKPLSERAAERSVELGKLKEPITFAVQPLGDNGQAATPMKSWQKRRWYDKKPQAAKAIRYLLAFPIVFQDVVCQTLLSLATQLPPEAIDPLKSLGTENIISLYKAKQKRRDYDQRELTHDTFRQLGVLSDAQRDVMIEHIHNLTEAFRGYLKLCKQFQAQPNLIDVRKLLEQYQAMGPEGCTTVLTAIHTDWEQRALLKGANLAFINTPKINTSK